MSWQILLLINLICATTRETLSKKIANKLDPFVMVFYVTVISGMLLYAYQFLAYQDWPRIDLVVTASGAFFVVAFVAYFSAVRISLSQSILFQSYSILVTIILAALFLGESHYFDITTITGFKTITGIILAFVALWFLLHQRGKKEQAMEKKWFLYIGTCILTLGVGSFFSVLFTKTYHPVEIFINQTNGSVPLLWMLMVMQKKSLQLSFSMMKTVFVNSAAGVGALLSFYELLQYIALSRIYPVQQVLLVIFTMTSSIVFYKEAHFFTGKRWIGMLVGLGGIVLLVSS